VGHPPISTACGFSGKHVQSSLAQTLHNVAPLALEFQSEADVETEAIRVLKSPPFSFAVKLRKTGDASIDKHWASKNKKLPSGEVKSGGFPDVLLYVPGQKRPFCVWENKARDVRALDALKDAQFYVKHLHEKMPIQPALPRLAAGFNGQELLLSYFTPNQDWVSLKANGAIVKDELPTAALLANGISAYGVLNSIEGYASASDLRSLLPRLKTIYRNIPPLTTDQGRTPIDFTIALLTVRLLVERRHEWGTWAEQPALQTPDSPLEKRILERLRTLANRITKTDKSLAERYGNILKFKEKEGGNEVAFNFDSVLNQIPSDRDHFKLIFDAIDSLPPLEHADFDIFGEVYQHIGDKATKKALGEFFTGRHIISGVLPVLFSRAGFDNSFASVRDKKIADIACGTGGFLT
jgi:hypothetical protein